MAEGDVYNAVAVFSHPNADGELVVTHDYRLDIVSAPLSEEGLCAELASQLRLEYETAYLPLISAFYTMLRVDVFNRTQPQYQATFPSGLPGTIVSDAVALKSAMIVAKKTGLRGRSYNGRSYFLAPTEDVQTAGQVTQAYADAVGLFCVNNLQSLVTGNANTYTHVIWSEVLLTATDIATYLPRITLGTQRGRQKAG